MNVVKEIQKINELELQGNGQGSWHDDYKDSAHIFVGGLPFNLTEGDVIAIFSQYGEIGDINMPRDKETQKVRGFAFLMYLDQRSTVLAVDNLNGAKVLNRTLRVDHTKNYRQTKILNEETGEMEDADEERMNALPKMIGGDGEPVSAAPAAIAPGNEEDPMAAYIRDSKRSRLLEDPSGSGSVSKSKEAKRAEKAAKRAEKEEKQRRKEAKRAGKDDRRHGDGESSRRWPHDDRGDRHESRRSTSRRAESPSARGGPDVSDRYRRRSPSPDPRDRLPTSVRERERSPGGAPPLRRRSPSPVRRPRSPPSPSNVGGSSSAAPRRRSPSFDPPPRRYPTDDYQRERIDHRDDRAYRLGQDDRGARDSAGSGFRGGRWDEREPRRFEERERRY